MVMTIMITTTTRRMTDKELDTYVCVGSVSRGYDPERHRWRLVGRTAELSPCYQLDADTGEDLWRGSFVFFLVQSICLSLM